MTHAELLRSHANLAIKEGGMYYSGECLSRIAATAESLEAENAKLRELLIDLKCAPCCGDSCWLHLPERLRELGMEVE